MVKLRLISTSPRDYTVRSHDINLVTSNRGYPRQAGQHVKSLARSRAICSVSSELDLSVRWLQTPTVRSLK